jgi:hypothetical protein
MDILVQLSSLASSDRKQSPLATTRESIQSAIIKLNSGTRHQVFDSTRNKNFTRPGGICHAPADCRGDATNPTIEHFTLASMKSCLNLHTQS